MKLYASEARAYKRVTVLIKHGFWPGIIRHGDKFRLSFDPDLRR